MFCLCVVLICARYSIAYAVLEHLRKVGALVLFATHYHALVDEYIATKDVQLAHMACKKDGCAFLQVCLPPFAPSARSERMVFLYTMVDGACPKSYGAEVARMAHLPMSVVARAQTKSREFEARFVY